MTAASNPDRQSLPIIARYTILETLYSGARTAVYRAVQTPTQQPVVIKVLRREYPSFGEIVQFRNQYTIAKNLPIPGIVRPLSLEPLRSGYALVMEDWGGVALGKYLQQQSLTLTEVLAIALQLADILHDLGQHRVIHKDIKPANILIQPETKQVKLIDFSIASLLPKETQEIQSANILEGTLAYIAPEQTGRMNRGIDYRADFYALGVTLYQLLTGKLPFESDDPLELIHCHIAKVPFLVDRVNPDVPGMVAAIVRKLMAKNAEDRYQSAMGLKHDLDRCLQDWEITGAIADFELGLRDFSDRFLIPEKLYGRETEVKKLLDAFDRVANPPQPPLVGAVDGACGPSLGGVEMMLVAGFSGIGKTAVINEVHKPIVRQRGYFIKGKFDQFNRNIPLSAFVQALRDLMVQLLSESDEQLAEWRERILQALGENGQILIEVIPELERIIGKQAIATELSGTAAQNRFNLLFQKFIEVFTTAEHPLVLFLDDLQWADLASLQLLKLLMNDKGYLLVLGAYRDNEVSPAHPFIMTVDELQKAQTIVNIITLASLAFEDTNHLVADTLNCSRDLAQPLTELVDRKTKGNPFFTTQFLKALHDDGYIRFEQDLRYWECDIAQVNSLSLTSDVVEFMALQLQKLPDETQQVLKLAACIGNSFDLNTLAIVSQQSLTDAATALWKALQEGFILPTDRVYKFFQGKQPETTEMTASANPSYRFLHDRVQQAAYSLIDEAGRQITHYHIGQLLLENLPPTEQKERLFDIANHMNMGRYLLTRNSLSEQESKTARIKLAKLNLAAVEKARLSIAYEAAISYCNVGISLLDREAWNTDDRLMLQLHRNLAESQLSQGNYPALEATTANILNHITVASDRADIQVIRIIQNTLQGKYPEAIGIGLDALPELGINIDRHRLAETNQREFKTIEQELEDLSISDLINLPLAIDPSIQAAIKILTAIIPPTYIIGDIETYTCVVLKATRLSIKYGNIAESIKAYANYGVLLGLVHQQYQLGCEFTDFAVQLSYKLNSRSQQSKACLLLGGWTQVWAKHIRGAADINYEGFLAGIDSGEIQFAGYNLFVNIFNRIFQGEKLESIALDLEKYWEFATKYQDETLLVAIAGANLYVRELRSRSDSEGVSLQEQLTSQTFWSEADIINRAQTSQSFLSLCLYYILKMQMAYLNANFEEGLHYIAEARKLINSILGFTTYSSYFYYASLILLNRYSELSATEQNETLQQVESNQQRLRGWADSCSENFLHKYFLVEAELQQMLDNKAAAIELYDFAITEARENGYIQEEALANELAAKFYLNWGQEKVAAGYMQSAYYGYACWGATAKVKDLQQRYPDLLGINLENVQSINPLETFAEIATPHFSIDTLTQTSHSSGSRSINASLDFATILKVSQSLSSTIQLDDLLYQLTQIILQNSGADRCALILPNAEGEWEVRAIGTPEETQLYHAPLQGNLDVPTKLIYYVKNTQEPVVIYDCETDLPVIDEYLERRHPKSVLCLPILDRGHSIGILYLKNRLTSGAFTRECILILNFLCTQAAISLENARLYAQEQQKTREITQREAEYRSIFESVNDGLLISHLATGRSIEVNPTICQMYGYTTQEWLHLVPSDLIHPDFICLFDDCLETLKAGQEFYTQSCWSKRKDGSYFDTEVKALPFLYRGEWHGLAIVRDISARKQAEQAVIEKSQELEQALAELQNTQLQMVQGEKMASLGNLVAGVAHEINNPIGFLNGSIKNTKDYVQDLLGHLELYQQHHPNPAPSVQENAEDIDLEFLCEDLLKMLNSMENASDRISSISTSLRTFSRADTEHKVSANLHEGIDSTLMILKYRLKANEDRPAIEVIQDYGDLPLVDCFPGQLNQVFMNILANAIDMFDEMAQNHSFAELKDHPQKITIRTIAHANQVQVQISDNGQGMTEEVKAQIFDHLFTTKGVGKGTGLGLAIARQIVEEKHGGTIAVESELGKGTTFVISLPR